MADALKSFLSGGLGGMSLVFVGHPLDTLKVKLQRELKTLLMVPGERIKVLLQTDTAGKYSGMLDCAWQVIREEGVRKGMYKGTALCFMRDCPGSVAYYGAYEISKRALAPSDGHGKLSVAATLTAGGLAGCAIWVVAVPPDVLKTRFQTAPVGRYPGGMRQILSELIKEEGVAGMYKGLGPAMVRAFPANAACFLGIEVSRK
eukprot:CAMPEP_0117467542 /NCGR_PEP_ID=MMETSP0784-20121206/5710_1 /TAXON_ID=39447 /ORGANISM="" /LENGTH=202 /DNA_ID=CAMNT_0005261515 /DNA_START=12 /DNA_END=621 /DNA_ORIENTATION=+